LPKSPLSKLYLLSHPGGSFRWWLAVRDNKALMKPRSPIVVAYAEGEPVAWAGGRLFGPRQDCFDVGVFVRKDHRNKGLVRKLARRLMRRSRDSLFNVYRVNCELCTRATRVFDEEARQVGFITNVQR
jgi:hypothetical protein